MIRKKIQSSFIFLTLQCRLFDTCVKPILLYCTEIWSPYSLKFVKVASKISKHNLDLSYEDFPPENNHTHFNKFLKGATNIHQILLVKVKLEDIP